jgi:hypothetical protein
VAAQSQNGIFQGLIIFEEDVLLSSLGHHQNPSKIQQNLQIVGYSFHLQTRPASALQVLQNHQKLVHHQMQVLVRGCHRQMRELHHHQSSLAAHHWESRIDQNHHQIHQQVLLRMLVLVPECWHQTGNLVVLQVWQVHHQTQEQLQVWQVHHQTQEH